MDYIYDQLVQDYGAVSYEAFINLLVRWLAFREMAAWLKRLQVDITEDQTSPEQLREAFRGLAMDKVRSPHAVDEGWSLTILCAAVLHRARPPHRQAACPRHRLPTRCHTERTE